LEGVPAREILAYADAKGMDLISMATHGRGEMA
jgi:nucleotide-binding universal stress UspA family protein